MRRKGILVSFLALLVFAGIVFGIKSLTTKKVVSGKEMTIYHSSSCVCCEEYAEIMQRKGFNVEERVDKSSQRMKIMNEAGIPQNMASCHTSSVDGYYFEGHIPAEVINKVVSEEPDIDGLVLPDMPSGSPGMPGTKSEEWEIYQGVDGEFTKYTTY